MELHELLTGGRDDILGEADGVLDRARVARYDRMGTRRAHARLADMLDLVIRCLRDRDALALSRAVAALTRIRYGEGFTLAEVQTAINVLERAVWHHVVAHQPPTEALDSLARVSGVFGTAKDIAGQTYVELAVRHRLAPVDLLALAHGAAAAVR